MSHQMEPIAWSEESLAPSREFAREGHFEEGGKDTV